MFITKKHIETIWRYTAGILVAQFPLILFTTLLLCPNCFYLDYPKTYITGWASLFGIDYENGINVPRDDLRYCIATGWCISLIISLLQIGGGKSRLNKAAKSLKVVWYALLIITFTIRCILHIQFGLFISTGTVNLFLESNIDEASGFIRSALLNWDTAKWVIKAMIIAIIISLAEWTWSKIKVRIESNTATHIASTIAFCMLTCMVAYSMKSYDALIKKCQNEFNLEVNTITRLTTIAKDIKENKKSTQRFYANVTRIANEPHAASCEEDSLDVIFVIGESFIRHHASIYGYTLPTTPLMEKEEENGNLVSFSDVITPFRLTRNSVENMLLLNTLEDGEQWYDHAFLPLLYNKAGYTTLVFDNQRGDDEQINGSFSQMYSIRVTSLSFDSVYSDKWEYDKEMTNGVLQTAKRNRGNAFYFIHLMGQHFYFKDRSPKEDKVFSASDIQRNDKWLTQEMRQEIADYDNAVIQTDMVLGQIFDMFRQRKAVVIFVSDHGEEVYDYRAATNRPMIDMAQKAEYARNIHSVPCFVWMSDKYKAAYPDIAQAVAEAKDRPYSNDRIGHMLLRLGHIKSPYYREKDDVTSKSYVPLRRRIYIDNDLKETLDYDNLIVNKSSPNKTNTKIK